LDLRIEHAILGDRAVVVERQHCTAQQTHTRQASPAATQLSLTPLYCGVQLPVPDNWLSAT
jgi:hypothetical protein